MQPLCRKTTNELISMNTKDESSTYFVEFLLTFSIPDWHRVCPFLLAEDRQVSDVSPYSHLLAVCQGIRTHESASWWESVTKKRPWNFASVLR